MQKMFLASAESIALHFNRLRFTHRLHDQGDNFNDMVDLCRRFEQCQYDFLSCERENFTKFAQC